MERGLFSLLPLLIAIALTLARLIMINAVCHGFSLGSR